MYVAPEEIPTEDLLVSCTQITEVLVVFVSYMLLQVYPSASLVIAFQAGAVKP
jgi:hypothetical protein